MRTENRFISSENQKENLSTQPKEDRNSALNLNLKEELEAFNSLFQKTLLNHNPDFQPMIDYIARGNGKRIRPLTVFLSAKLCGKIQPETIEYAVILELLHTATLIHDDVVDNTMERRNLPSVNAKYDNRIAVLLGDYVLTLAIEMGIKEQNPLILQILSNLSKNLIEGELSQLISSKNSIAEESRYFDVIRKKTAALISSCTEMGAISVKANQEKTEKLRLIGEKLGLCFQIKDDIFDYFEQGNIGKPTGNDIREGKITLPLIYALQEAPKEIADEKKTIIKKQDFAPETISDLIAFAKEYGGIAYAQKKMESLKEEVLEILNDFPDSEAKQGMIDLVDYIIRRTK
jgi:Geranylgeranyl pyrophosphate synthase